MRAFRDNRAPAEIANDADRKAADYAFDDMAQVVIDDMGKIENKGLGLSASIPAGEGASLSVSYSKYDSEHSSAAKGWFSNVAGNRPAATEPNHSNITATAETEMKRIGISFSYDLGGGATFNAGIEKDDTETTYSLDANENAKIFPKDSSVAVGGDGDQSSVSETYTTDKTTLSASLSFSF